MAAPDVPVDLGAALARIHEHWSPRTVAEANGWHLKVAKVVGEFVPHRHDVDEVFLVLSGELELRLTGRDAVQLATGEVFVVPRGVEHQPVAEQECHIALLEPAGVVNTGDAGGDLTAPVDDWL